jgi:hypothetical protein
MEMRYRFAWRMLAAAISFLFIFGCAPAPVVLPTPPPPLPAFPPQRAMETGDYAGFLAENQQALQACNTESPCAVALFNVGFLHAYPNSPYYNQVKGLKYFEELIQKYPQSPWAFQAKAWTDIMKQSVASENKRRRLLKEMKSKDAAINDLKRQIKRSREIDMKIEQKERELLK